MSAEIREFEPIEVMDDPGRLMAGDIVRFGENVEALDLFNVNLGRYAVSYDYRYRALQKLGDIILPTSFSGVMRYPYLKGGCVPPSVGLHPKKFLGKIIDLAVLIPEDIEPLYQSGGVQYIATGRLKSSGKPASDLFSTVVSIKDINSNKFFAVGYKPYKSCVTPEQVADQIIEASSQSAHQIVVNGLKHLYSGGLPS